MSNYEMVDGKIFEVQRKEVTEEDIQAKVAGIKKSIADLEAQKIQLQDGIDKGNAEIAVITGNAATVNISIPAEPIAEPMEPLKDEVK